MANKTQNVLLTPGPVPVPEKVLKALSEPMIHHRTPEFTEVLTRCLTNLKKVFCTSQPVLIHTSTGSGAMESAVVNCFKKGDEVLCIVSGKFGERWADICEVYGLKVHRLNIEWGKALELTDVINTLRQNPNISAVLTQYCETSTATLHPVPQLAQALKDFPEVLFCIDAITAVGAAPLLPDEWGLDVVVAGSQKAFMMPTGLSFVTLSEKAWLRSKTSNLPKYYFNLAGEKKANEKGQTLFSSAVSHIKALDQALLIMLEQGVDQIRKRIENLAEATIAMAKVFNLKVYSQSPSPSVTALLIPDGIDGGKFRAQLEKDYQVTVMGGQDQLTGKIIRIGHLGNISNEDMFTLTEKLGALLIRHKHIEENCIETALQTCQGILGD